MEVKPDKQASKAALDKKCLTTLPERQKFGEESQAPEHDPPITEPSKSPTQTSDQLARTAAVQKKVRIKL